MLHRSGQSMEDKRKTATSKHSDLRIVLVGKTGAGKSSAGNTIFGRTVFKSEMSSKSITNDCQKHLGTVDGRNISVIDTPGLFDTNGSMSEEKLKECVRMSVPGPHVFLLVMSLVKYTDEEKNAVKWIQENFGEEATRYTIILFTRGDELEGKTLDDYISENNDLKALVKVYHNRYHSFNNKDLKNRSQVTELLEKIEKMVEENGGQHYTNEMYKKAQEEVEWEARKEKLKDYGKKALLIGGGAVVAGAVAGVGAVVAGPEAVVAAVSTGGAVVIGAAKSRLGL